MFLAAENGALPNGKVGGLGDVVRDLPAALAERGWRAAVMTPAYGIFAQLPGAERGADLDVPFAGTEQAVALYEVPGGDRMVRHYVLDHPRFAPREPGRIYTDDLEEGPFATDATKFAFFCAAAAAAVREGAIATPQVLHLHDWQAALTLLLRESAPAYAPLRRIRTVFTIHNIAMQGVRPLAGHPSALTSWFPDLAYDRDLVADPRWPDCVNPVRVGIRLADAVSTVSPTYAREILEPSDPQRGFSGGEGLEGDLKEVDGDGRLIGILNGCTYPQTAGARPRWEDIVGSMRTAVASWGRSAQRSATAQALADERLAGLVSARPEVVLTNIGRITAQKVQLFRQHTEAGVSAIEAILGAIGSRGLLVMVGSGEREYEEFLMGTARDHDNFLFLNGYSESLVERVYADGDLFLMPSSFEPCGISQMLAMRAGQPCVVHAVGGLKDTVIDGVNGFVFDGETPSAQASAFVAATRTALTLQRASPAQWQRMRDAAAAARFSWAESAAAYESGLYGV